MRFCSMIAAATLGLGLAGTAQAAPTASLQSAVDVGPAPQIELDGAQSITAHAQGSDDEEGADAPGAGEQNDDAGTEDRCALFRISFFNG